MTNLFSVSFMNVENFFGKAARAERVATHIRNLNTQTNGPDVISFCEIKDKGKIREVILDELIDYDFALTDTGAKSAINNGKTEIEILVGWKRGVFEQTLFTQRVDLKGGRRTVRPGALLNVKQGGIWFSLVFLHTKSGAHKTGYYARKKSLARLWKLKNALKAIDDTNDYRLGSRIVVMGDLNTMGNGSSVTGREEVGYLRNAAEAQDMELVAKEFDLTFGQNWKYNPLTSNLDHVLTYRTNLRELGKRLDDNDPFQVAVRGWNQLIGDEKALVEYEKNLSDHSALYVEVVS